MSDICDKRLDLEIVKWVATGPPDSYGRSINSVALAREVLELREEIDRLRLDVGYLDDIARTRGEENERLRNMLADSVPIDLDTDDFRAWRERFWEIATELAAIKNALPDCLPCDGKGYKPMLTDIGPNPLDYKCPDCIDGKVPIEKLVGLWTAATDPASDLHNVLVNMALDQYIEYRKDVG